MILHFAKDQFNFGMKNNVFIIIFITIFFIECDKGLSPYDVEQVPAGISGIVYFQNWPIQDSLYDIRVVAFRNYPPQNIVEEVLTGSAIVFPGLSEPDTISFYIDSLAYSMKMEAGLWEFLAVAQQFGPDLYNDWRVAGQYVETEHDSLPSPIILEEGEFLSDLNIHVNFDSLPPQPFHNYLINED